MLFRSRVDQQKRRIGHQPLPIRRVDYRVRQAEERIVCSQADIEVIGSVEMKPVNQNERG